MRRLMQMMRHLPIGLIWLILLPPALHTQVRAVVPAQSHANRFYSPGVDAGDYVYISGQGARRPDGSLPANFSAQVRQALDNVKAIVGAAGLNMDHVVYTQVYLETISRDAEMNSVVTTSPGKP